MIAALVLSIGLLGLAGLQMNALKNNQSSMERSMAVIESYSVVEAMRSDRTNAINGAFNIGLDETPSGTSYADNELTNWRNRLATLLGPDATGSVACAGAGCTIIIQWNDSRGIEVDVADDPMEAMQVVTEVRL
jgi:type IV pilus assembly protein PilV